ncbi:MAG: ATP-grasp domain-containing protein [Anaerovoracaceae bacterium]|jgi:hypothetical protein
MIKMILFPSDYFDKTKVDADLQKEYDAALDTGLFEIALFDYEKWFLDDRLSVSGAPGDVTLAAYRGWMMKPEQYERFYDLLLQRNIKLISEPNQYKLMHIFPNVYEYVKEDTAKMAIYPLHKEIPLEEVKKEFDKFMVKDFVKSVKGTKFPKFFDASISQREFNDWMQELYKYRGELLTGGICIKEFLNLKYYGDKTNEWRVFYMNHEPATISRNSLQADFAPAPPQSLIDKYRDLDSSYYTIDFAELADGTWRIIEAGDGQVSGLSEGQDYNAYFRALHQCFGSH